jgi:hypothetical protein
MTRQQARVIQPSVTRFPAYAFAGLLMNLLAWGSSWFRIGPWEYTFLPLWCGFILFIDGLNVAIHGHSLLTRSLKRAGLVFLSSSASWWVFEGCNAFVQNWHYRSTHEYEPLMFFLLASLYFSTALPAIIEVSELLTGWKQLRPKPFETLSQCDISRRATASLVCIGLAFFLVSALIPHLAFGLIWLAAILVFDPINHLAHRKSIIGRLQSRDWKFLTVLALGTLLCGFLWELWNFHAMPQWYYTIPYFDSTPHLFELPVAGYLGYLPFGLELYAMYQFSIIILVQAQDALVF